MSIDNNYIIDNSLLFFKIWRCNYIKNYIIEFLRIYEKVFNLKQSFSIQELEDYKYRDWLTFVHVNNRSMDYSYNSNSMVYYSGNIPDSVISCQFNDNWNFKITKGLLGKNIRKLVLGNTFQLKNLCKNSIPDTLEKLILSNPNSFNGENSNVLLELDNIKVLEFGPDFNSVIYKGQLPNNLKSLKFGRAYDQPLSNLNVPNGLINLEFGRAFNKPILNDNLPITLTRLTFGHSFNQVIEPRSILNLKFLKFGQQFSKLLKVGSLPLGLLELHLGDNWNHPLLASNTGSPINSRSNGNNSCNSGNSILPCNLEILYLSKQFNYPCFKGSFPISLQVLVFGDDWNQDIIENTLSILINLKSITFGSSYNRIIKAGCLPSSSGNLKYIKFGDSFNMELSIGSIPESVEKIEFGKSFNRHLKPFTSLPINGNLKYLIFGLKFNNDENPISIGTFPKSILSIEFQSGFNQILEIDSIPNNITCLSTGYEFNQIISIGCLSNCTELKTLKFGSKFNNGNKLFEIGSLPPSLTKLEFGSVFSSKYNQPILPGLIPSSCEYLQLGASFNHLLEKGCIPYGVQTLKLSKDYNLPLSNDSIPSTVTYLDLGSSFNHPIKLFDNIPLSIQILKLSDSFNQPLNALIKNSNNYYSNLKTIIFGDDFNSVIEPLSIPFGVTTIKFKKSFNQPIVKNTFPDSVTSLSLSESFQQPLTPENLPMSSLISLSLNFRYDRRSLPQEITHLLLF